MTTLKIHLGTCAMIPKGQYFRLDNSGDIPMVLLASRTAPSHTSYVNDESGVELRQKKWRSF